MEDDERERRVGEPRGAPPALHRPKLTVAVPFPVYPPVGGGQQRVFSLYRHVARDFDVELVTLAESDAAFAAVRARASPAQS